MQQTRYFIAAPTFRTSARKWAGHMLIIITFACGKRLPHQAVWRDWLQ